MSVIRSIIISNQCQTLYSEPPFSFVYSLKFLKFRAFKIFWVRRYILAPLTKLVTLNAINNIIVFSDWIIYGYYIIDNMCTLIRWCFVLLFLYILTCEQCYDSSYWSFFNFVAALTKAAVTMFSYRSIFKAPSKISGFDSELWEKCARIHDPEPFMVILFKMITHKLCNHKAEWSLSIL